MPRSDSTSLPSSVARTVGLVVLLGTGILLASGCNEKESRTTGLPATNDDGTPLAVKCNTRSIAKKLEPSNEGSTPKSAFLIFLAKHKAKREESHPPASEFEQRGGERAPVFIARKGGRIVDRIDLQPNGSGGFFVATYEVCPAND